MTVTASSSCAINNPLHYRTVQRVPNAVTHNRPYYASPKGTDIQLTLPYLSEKVAAVELTITCYALSAELGNDVFRVGWVATLTPGLTTE